MGGRHFSTCTFCPKCGVESIERDTYRKNNEPDRGAGKPEFICLTCGFGFLLSASLRVEHGNSLFKAHRAGKFDGDYKVGRNKIS